MAEVENKKQRCKNCGKDGKTVVVSTSNGLICQECAKLPLRPDGKRTF